MSGPQIGARTADTMSTLSDGRAFAVGDTMTDHNGYDWMFVRSGAAITQYDCVHIDGNFDANAITDTLAKTAGQIGFAQVAFATSALYGWVMLRGKCTVRLAASTPDDVPLFTSATAGILTNSTGSASHSELLGCRANSSASGGGVTAVECVAGNVVPRRPLTS